MRVPRVALVFVPQGEPAMPHAALPLLKAHLRARLSITADLFDLNLTFYRQLLSEFGADPALARLDGRAWDPAAYPWALASALAACGSFSDRHPGFRLSLKNLAMPGWDRSSAGLLRAVLAPDNPFAAFFAPHVARLAAYDVVGLSLAWSGQLLPLFTLAHQVRRARPDATLALGGSLVPHLLDSLLAADGLMEPFDYLVPHEGEAPLAAIVEASADGQTAPLPGAFTLPRRGRAARGPAGVSAPLTAAAISSPDFSGLPVADYLSPVVTLPVIATRGCHYGSCAYCDHDHHVSAPLRRPVERVAAELETLRRRHGARGFAFVDDSMPADVLDGLSRQLPGKSGPPLRFSASTRLDPALSPERLERAAAAGCHALLFGLESGSQRMLNRMGKGIDLLEARRVLGDAHAAGILTWCFFMAGYPGETTAEMQATFEFLRRHRPVIDVIAGGPFVLTRRSPLARLAGGRGAVTRLPDLALRIDGGDGLPSLSADRVAAELAAADDSFRGLYPTLPAFVEAHALALSREDYRQRFVASAGAD